MDIVVAGSLTSVVPAARGAQPPPDQSTTTTSVQVMEAPSVIAVIAGLTTWWWAGYCMPNMPTALRLALACASLVGSNTMGKLLIGDPAPFRLLDFSIKTSTRSVTTMPVVAEAAAAAATVATDPATHVHSS